MCIVSCTKIQNTFRTHFPTITQMSEYVDQSHKREALGGGEPAEECASEGLSWSPPLPWGPFRHWRLRRLKESFPLISWPQVGWPEADESRRVGLVGAACFATGMLTGGSVVALAMGRANR